MASWNLASESGLFRRVGEVVEIVGSAALRSSGLCTSSVLNLQFSLSLVGALRTVPNVALSRLGVLSGTNRSARGRGRQATVYLLLNGIQSAKGPPVSLGEATISLSQPHVSGARLIVNGTAQRMVRSYLISPGKCLTRLPVNSRATV